MSVITNKWNDGSGDSISIESPSFQGNQTVKISSPVQKGTSKRSMQFIGKCKKDSSKQVILTVEQEASVYTYDLILSSDNTEIAAKGGTANITAVLKTYRNGNLVSTDNVTPVLSGSATGFSISGTKVTASNRTTTVGNRRSIVVTGKYSNTFDGQTVLSTINIYQEANNKTVKEITNRYVSSNPFTGQNTVKANGGTVKVNTFAIYNYTSGSTSETDVSSECTFINPQFGTWNSNTHVWTCPSAGTTVYEDNRDTSITVKWNDKTTHYYLYQQANTASYGALTGGSVSASDIPASGGTSSTNVTNMSQTISYTSGSTRAGTVTYSKTDEITVSSLGTTVKVRTKVGQVTVTYTGEGGAVANKTTDIYQAENKVTNSNYNPRITAYGTPTISIDSGLTAAGGSATVSASVTNTETYNALYSSGATGPNQTRSVGGSLSISMTVNGNSRFSLSGNTITHSSMGTNETTDTVTIKVVNDGDSSKSATASKSITNSKTVKSISGGVYRYGYVTSGPITNATIPASGGSATAKAGNGTQNWSKSATITTYQYDSGSTKDVTTEKASSGTNNVSPGIASIEATASSKGTTVSSQTIIKKQPVLWLANGESAGATMYIYQAENKVTNSNYNPRITAYGTPTISIDSGLTAAGGSATVSASVTNTETYNALYSSGATGPNQTRSVGGSLSISMTVNGNSRFSLSGNTITHSSMGTNETTDTVTIKVVNDGDSSKSATASKSITNSKTVKSISGGVYRYGYVTSGPITNATIPASGGSATAKAGNGTQNWSKSATITTYQYDSGSTKDVTTEKASSGTNNVSPGIASIEATASSKGTTVSSQTIIKKQPVLWLANGESAGATMYIYQEANKIESYNYDSWNIDITANPTTIAASGGTSTITASCTRTKTPVYTSGSTGTATTESATPTLALTTNPGGFTLSGNKLTAANNTIGAKTAIVTASYSGATSKSVTITQSAGPDGIGYMQIEGDGKSHPIFRVGNITRSIEPTSVNQNSDITSDKDSSIFASLKQLLFKFI